MAQGSGFPYYYKSGNSKVPLWLASFGQGAAEPYYPITSNAMLPDTYASSGGFPSSFVSPEPMQNVINVTQEASPASADTATPKATIPDSLLKWLQGTMGPQPTDTTPKPPAPKDLPIEGMPPPTFTSTEYHIPDEDSGKPYVTLSAFDQMLRNLFPNT